MTTHVDSLRAQPMGRRRFLKLSIGAAAAVAFGLPADTRKLNTAISITERVVIPDKFGILFRGRVYVEIGDKTEGIYWAIKSADGTFGEETQDRVCDLVKDHFKNKHGIPIDQLNFQFSETGTRIP